MEYKRIAKRLFFLTLIIIIVLNLLNLYPYFRIFIGSFGFGGTIILWIIGNAMHDDE